MILPADTPRLADIGLHWHVFLFAGVASVLTGVFFGLVPALKMASPNLQQTLRSGSLSVIGKGVKFRVSMALVVGQIALSVVVITTAGLLLHSLYGLSRVDPASAPRGSSPLKSHSTRPPAGSTATARNSSRN